jgi:hypothetical protein
MKIKGNVFRKDCDRMFENTEVLSCVKLSHTPFIVLDEKDGITLCFNAQELVMDFPANTKVLQQWRGNWSSDFLQFQVIDVLLALKEKDKELKTYANK